jgi:3-hydroxyisobutyrate dehydrogenase
MAAEKNNKKDQKPAVGFIGLGNIGKPIAQRLVDGPFEVQVYDVSTAAAAELVAAGAQLAVSPAALAASCDYIGICVRDNADVETLLYGPGGLLVHASAGTHIAIHSTVTQAGLLKWAVDAAKLELVLIDAPITGGAQRALDGTLCYMVGGSQSALDFCSPMYQASAEKIVHAGALGSGIALKLCNNLIQYTEFLAMSEATRLAVACGLSAEVLREVGLSNGVVNPQMHQFVSGRNALLETGSEEQMEQFFGAMGRLGYKDLQCALDTASDHDLRLPATEIVRDMIEDVFLGKA